MVAFKSFLYCILILFVLQYGYSLDNPNSYNYTSVGFTSRDKLVQRGHIETYQVMNDRLLEKKKVMAVQMKRQLSDEEKEESEKEPKTAMEEKTSVQDNDVKEVFEHGKDMRKGLGHGKGMHHGKKAKFVGKLRSEMDLKHHHHHVHYHYIHKSIEFEESERTRLDGWFCS